MTHDEVQNWLDAYVLAWSNNDPNQIGELFTEDAVYRYRPWESEKHSVTGRNAIVASWIDNYDDPSVWEAQYSPYAIEGNRAVAVGWTRYVAVGEHPERTYHNAFVIQFGDGGRCSEFSDFYVVERA